VGEKLVEIPEDGSVLRHFYQNFNIKATKDGTDTFTAFKRLKKHQAGIISLAETNSNWKNGLIRENFRNQMFRNWENRKYRTSTSNWKSNSLNKPGGTVTMATNRWSGRASMSGEDPWGLGQEDRQETVQADVYHIVSGMRQTDIQESRGNNNLQARVESSSEQRSGGSQSESPSS
jgi:hypothetical protein